MQLAWQYPEWWTLTLSGVSWAYLWAEGAAETGHVTTAAHMHQAGLGILPSQTIVRLGEWMIMVAAMMLPMVVGPIRVTARRSLWRRRHRAIAEFLAGYLAVWIAIGVFTVIVCGFLAFDPGPMAVAGFLVAAAWGWTAAHRRALAVCHRTVPLAPSGWRADVDCLRYGWTIGKHCAVSCWAVMFACALAGHAVDVMIVATLLMAAERYSYRPRVRITSVALVIVAASYAAVWLR